MAGKMGVTPVGMLAIAVATLAIGLPAGILVLTSGSTCVVGGTDEETGLEAATCWPTEDTVGTAIVTGTMSGALAMAIGAFWIERRQQAAVQSSSPSNRDGNPN